jgi:tetratricopeptide (TPR) repeat protein
MILVTCALLIVCAAVPALSQPQPVPRLVERSLDKASYVELAKQWKRYIEKNGETADALVNLGMAYRYSDEQDAAVIAGRRAVEIGPDNPKALAFLGGMLAVWVEDDEGALKVLERCRKVAPDYEWGLTTLATVYMRRGEWAKSEEVFKTVFEQKVIPQPLQDYAYNMLVGLPNGAVLITGGDDDTFPPLALQAGMNFRKDVIVANRSLLNLPSYANALFKRYPSIKPDYDIDKHETTMTSDGKAALLATRLIERMMAEKKAPLFFAASANYESYGFKPEARVEGINLRASGEGLSAEESARLFLCTYRLDSATDWDFPWSLAPKVSDLMLNYAAAMVKSVEAKGVSKETRTRLLDKASAIAEFHDFTDMSQHIESLRKK